MVEAWRKVAPWWSTPSSAAATTTAGSTGCAPGIFNALLSRLGGDQPAATRRTSSCSTASSSTRSTRDLPERQRFYRGLADWVGLSARERSRSTSSRAPTGRASGRCGSSSTWRSTAHRLVHQRPAAHRDHPGHVHARLRLRRRRPRRWSDGSAAARSPASPRRSPRC